LSVDTHLPAVSHERMQEVALRARFKAPPIWQPEFVQERAYLDRPMARAAVLLGLVMRDEPMVLLTRRANHMSTHSGQVAFPGGKVDPLDRDLRHTALREAHEEVGLSPALVQVLGELPTYTTGSALSSRLWWPWSTRALKRPPTPVRWHRYLRCHCLF
jgi:8-oxo-dGTP pyrophosphatase MutT (NUDIX family)